MAPEYDTRLHRDGPNATSRITKSDMGLCNRILKRVKTHYRIDIDWRGDIESDHYTEYVLNKKRNVDADLYAQDTWKSNKMNLLYSWKEW